VSEPALETYLRGQEPRVAPLVRALDAAIRKAAPELDAAIKYKMLMYSLRGDWRTWVCAVGTSTKQVQLRFLYGVLLDDPRGILRAGTSVLKTWDFDFDDEVDAQAVGAYVTEAVSRYGDYKANASQVLAAHRRTRPA
jgi:hypothetical protein